MFPEWLERLSPEENMRRDTEALLAVERGEKRSVRRIYGWSELCLSLGYRQDPPADLSIPVVRRPTGGGALLHGWDVSFSLVGLRELWGRQPTEIYLRTAHLIGRVFERSGIQVTLNQKTASYRREFYCFLIPSRGEVLWKKRKIASMAMRTLRRAFLVHGSVYLSFDYPEASRITGVSENILRERIVSLEETGRRDSFLKELRRVFGGVQSNLPK